MERPHATAGRDAVHVHHLSQRRTENVASGTVAPELIMLRPPLASRATPHVLLYPNPEPRIATVHRNDGTRPRHRRLPWRPAPLPRNAFFRGRARACRYALH